MVLKGMECNLHILNGKIDELTTLAANQDKKRIKAKLQEILPEYSPSSD